MIVNTLASYMESLTATNTICNEFGETFNFGTNLFIGFEPEKDTDTVTLIPYSGTQPNIDSKRQEAAIQIRLKTSSRYKALAVQQACIDTLDMNTLNSKCFMRANNSAPLLLSYGNSNTDRWKVSVSNYMIKYVK